LGVADVFTEAFAFALALAPAPVLILALVAAVELARLDVGERTARVTIEASDGPEVFEPVDPEPAPDPDPGC
jgi:hypothetical protein